MNIVFVTTDVTRFRYFHIINLIIINFFVMRSELIRIDNKRSKIVSNYLGSES